MADIAPWIGTPADRISTVVIRLKRFDDLSEAEVRWAAVIRDLEVVVEQIAFSHRRGRAPDLTAELDWLTSVLHEGIFAVSEAEPLRNEVLWYIQRIREGN
jgi:hypothetical protein